MDRRKKSIVLKAIAFLFVGIGSYFVFINREIDPHYGIPFWIVAFIIMVISELVGKYKNPNISKSEKVSSIIPYVLFVITAIIILLFILTR